MYTIHRVRAHALLDSVDEDCGQAVTAKTPSAPLVASLQFFNHIIYGHTNNTHTHKRAFKTIRGDVKKAI